MMNHNVRYTPLPLGRVAAELDLSRQATRHLQSLGIDTVEMLLGVAYVDPTGLADELNVSLSTIYDLTDILREHISPEMLRQIEASYYSPGSLPTGAELKPAVKAGTIADYEEA